MLLDEIERRAELLSLEEQLKAINVRSSKLLPFLSGLIPGLGQVFVGRVKEAITSFLLCNTIAFVGIASVFVYRNNTLLLYLYPWFLRYYIGGIKRSQLIVQQINIEKIDKLFQEVLDVLSMEKESKND